MSETLERFGMGEPAGQHTVRALNTSLVLRHVAASPGASRAQLAQTTGLTRATVSALVDDLLAAGLVIELDPAPATRGRPGNPLQLNPQGPAGLGVEVNVDYVSACLVDLTGTVRARRTEHVDNTDTTPRAALRRAAQLAAVLLASAPVRPAGVALALPGLIRPDGVVERAPNLPRWQGVAVAGMLAEMLEAPVVAVENEANLAALAEHWYGGMARDFVHVTGEIGVGGGLILDGELFRGVRGFAGELGHVMVDPDGPRCGCGSRGCLEQVAGQGAILRGARAAGEDELMARAAREDRRALAALGQAGRALGVALSGLVNIVDVPAVVLGGFYARLGPWLVPPLATELHRRVVSRAPVDVRVSALGGEAAMLGGAGLVVSQIMAAPGARRSSTP